MQLTYLIDGRPFTVEAGPASEFSTGADECLSERFDDLARAMEWYSEGYTVIPSAPFFDFAEVKADVEQVVRRAIGEVDPAIDLAGFRLEDYHRYVDASLHGRVIGKTRRLYPADFSFDQGKAVARLGEMFGARLGYRSRLPGDEQWIIARINPPGSLGFNPAHKDAYEEFDTFGEVPRMINVWIPICGVGEGTGLPVAAGSHLVRENQVLRTLSGSVVEGQAYSVNCIKSWAGRSDLTTLCPTEDRMLVFSSHLIHGLGRNNHADTTRISLEFRLLEQAEA